jgi:hypothetical protein
MSKSTIGLIALIAGAGAVAKSQVPEIRRYLKVRQM